MTRPVVRVISPDATPEEVAAILAAVGALTQPGITDHPAGQDHWVDGARLAARGARLQRGSWRLSGRIAGRSRP